MFIYTKRCQNKDFLIYIGSTKTTLSRRWSSHKQDCKFCTYIRNNGGIENYYIELYEKFEGNLDESRKKEVYIIRE